jgi:ribose transport system ATP-binding protein
MGQVRRRVVEAISHFDHPEIRPDVKVSKLSVAAQQLVEIARALAIGCRVLVLDEPTSSLTQRDVKRLFELIEHLKKDGMAIVYISHFLEEVQQVADEITVLRDGNVVGTRLQSEMTTDDMIGLMVGRKVEDLYPRSVRTPGEVVLDFAGLAGVKHPVSAGLQLRRGEVLGIAGLMGAGRTELLRALFGLDPVRRGTIRMGVYSGTATPARRWKQGMGMLSEDRKEEGLALSLTVADNVTLSRLRGFGPMGMVLPWRQEDRTRHWINKLDIRCRSPKQKVLDLSGGNQQKVAFARMLQHDVDVLLLDEPTRGIDVAAKATVYKLIDELACGSVEAGREPRAIMMVSSYLPELMGVCDRIAVMCRGRLGPAHPVNEIDEHRLMLEATGQEMNA